MKKLVVLAIVLAFFAGASYRLIEVHAQSIGVSPSAATPLSGCPAPAANFMNLCQVTGDPANVSGGYFTAAGQPYFLLQPAGGGSGVSSYNNRKGAVLPTIGDYTFPMVAGVLSPSQIPTHTCTMTTVSGSGNAIVQLSNCK